MTSTMHRLQISLPEWQAEYLRARAERDGVSIAEVVRRLVEREAETVCDQGSPESLWSIAGLAEDQEPLVDGVPVSERPELYLNERLRQPSGRSARPPKRKRNRR